MKPTLIDLFSGCGGVTQGFKNREFEVLSAVEWDPVAAKTYRINHSTVEMYQDDIRNVDPKEMMRRNSLASGELTVLSVCAPCQPFSRQTRKEGKDNRTKLILEMIRFVEALQPQLIIMENVPGLNRGKNKKVLSELLSGLRDDLKYNVLEPKIVDAVNYGVPQFRKRLILLGSRDKLPLKIPEATHSCNGDDFTKESWRTVKDAFKGIPCLKPGQKSDTDPLHKARNHRSLTINRLKHIPQNGGSRKSLPDELVLDCHKRCKGYNDVYGRMDFSRPSNTLTTGCTNVTKGRFAHPTANRAITPREAARLQTFPDSYRFEGNYDEISTQIGNAVPVRLAEVFAKEFFRLWEHSSA